MNCDELFKEVITEFGLCCSFNLLPDVFKKTNETKDKNWSLEGGYANPPALHMAKNPHLQEKPYRTDIAGLPGGLSFTLDLQAGYCTIQFFWIVNPIQINHKYVIVNPNPNPLFKMD